MLVNQPPKGWNSWNTFGEKINEELIRETAEKMVSSGLKDKGYEYIVIDDCWCEPFRDENGRLTENKKLFPSGMKALADYVHSLGLKFGMYSDAGMLTCMGYPGSYGHEFEDAETFASFDIDLLKYDFCSFPTTADATASYNKMSMALKATGRDILFSLCNGGANNVAHWARAVGGHMYRTTGDIGERFSAIFSHAEDNRVLMPFSSKQCYADPDMMVVGMDGIGNVGHPGACGDTEYKTHFACWCMMNAPLMIGSDLRRLRPEMIELLSNEDLLRIDNDEEYRPLIETASAYNPNRKCFFKHLSNNQFAIGLFNFTDEKGRVDFRPFNIGYALGCGFGMKLREVFTGEVIDYIDGYFKVELEAHDCSVFIGEYVTEA